LKREAKRKRKAEEEASKAAALPEVDPSAYGYARSTAIHIFSSNIFCTNVFCSCAKDMLLRESFVRLIQPYFAIT
jgi:hypothetical protein